MQYIVTFDFQGDETLREFDCTSSALEFIKKGLNDDQYGDFRLYCEMPFDISIGLSVN